MPVIKPLFVIWGYGSENIFRDFAGFLRQRGHEVVVLPEAGLDKRAELERLASRPFILLTSAHFTRDERILGDFYPDIHIDNAFLELLYHCPPLLSAFYPHDLSTPLVINEPAQLSGFDLVLWPTRYFGYQPRPHRLLTVGWIGYRNEYRPAEDRRYDSALLFSDICAHKGRLGVAGTYDKLAPILACGTAIKFPDWPGHDEFEEYFSAQGAVVIPAETAAGDVILDSRLIVSNSISSISVEASLMGTPVINLIEDYLPSGMQREFLSGLPGCILSSYGDFPEHLAAPPCAATPQVERFDPEHTLNLILDALVDKHGPGVLKDSESARPATMSVEILCSPKPPQMGPPGLMQVSSRKIRIKKVHDASPAKPDITTAAQASHEVGANTDEINLATAVRLLEQGEVNGAFTMLQELVTAGSTHWGPYYHIARLAQAQGEADIGFEFLTHAVQREQPPGIAHRSLAQLHLSAGRYQETLSTLSPLLRHDSRDYEALDILRHALGQMPEISPIAWARLLADLRFRPT